MLTHQNEALYQICVNDLKQKSPEYKDLNELIAKVMTGFTCTFRPEVPVGNCTLTWQPRSACVYSTTDPQRAKPKLTQQPRCPQLGPAQARGQHGCVA